MRRLSDTLARLAALVPNVELPGHGDGPSRLREVTGFGSNPGALRGWAFVPDVLAPGAPLVVVLHGCTQTAAGYDRGAGWSALAERHGFAVLYPEQQRANNPNTCFNWFVPEDTRRGSGEVLSIRQMVAAITAAHRLDAARVFVTGLSAGGAMASAMLAAYPEVFAGGAIIAGLAHGTASTIPEAFDRMRGHGGPRGAALGELVRSASSHRGPWPIVSVWQGASDATVHPDNAQQIVEQWRGVHGVSGSGAVEQRDGYARTAWRDPGGRLAVELFEVPGLGHGTPLSPLAGDEARGEAGPFMLDVGVPSTHLIARGWGLIDDAAITAPPPRPRAGARAASAAGGPARVVEDALRAAGLLR